MKFSLALLFIIIAAFSGYAIQETSGCTAERHAAEVEGKAYCFCTAMGGYRYCKDGHWNYQQWSAEDRKTPECSMSCKEDKCDCCHLLDDLKKRQRRKISIPYDPL